MNGDQSHTDAIHISGQPILKEPEETAGPCQLTVGERE
jgi:hypothetical protein